MANFEYTVMFRDHNDAANGDFNPGSIIEFVPNTTHLGWSEYINEVGEAFFTMSQSDAKAMRMAQYNEDVGNGNILSARPHMQIYRNNEKVWAGWLGEIDETENDVIFYGYSYLSGFYDLLTPFVDKTLDSTVADLVDGYFDMAQGKAFSRVHWINKGTIENPWTDDTQTTGITMPLYRTSYKRILVAFKELAAYAISDTNNKVIFEVTPDGVFNFWRDKNSDNHTVKMSFPFGHVRSFRRIRRPILRRTHLYGVGASPTVVLHNDIESNGLHTALGRSEEPILLSYVRDDDELERVLKARATRAGHIDSDFYMTFNTNTLVPYRADNPDFILGQNITTSLWHGASWKNQESKVISGQQVIWHRKAENVRLLLTDTLV